MDICGVFMITTTSIGISVPPTKGKKDPKAAALLANGTMNPFPDRVADEKFRTGEFFDARDIVQVKYEMLRRVLVDHASVTDATDEYGVSRPTYYEAKACFDDAGVAGLVPKKRGPRGPHKLQGEILAFIDKHLVSGEPIRARSLARMVREEFSVEVHPRTIERALAVKKTPR
jgi:transposase